MKVNERAHAVLGAAALFRDTQSCDEDPACQMRDNYKSACGGMAAGAGLGTAP